MCILSALPERVCVTQDRLIWIRRRDVSYVAADLATQVFVVLYHKFLYYPPPYPPRLCHSYPKLDLKVPVIQE